MSQPSLEEAAINFGVFREQAVRELVDGFEAVEGRKVLVLDPKLSGPLGLVVEVPLLKSHGIESIYHLTAEGIDTECENIIFLCRPRPELMRVIAYQVRYNVKKNREKIFHLMFVPRRTMIAERVLEEESVYADLNISEYQLDLIPFEKDVLSLELDDSYRQCTLEGDETSLYYVGRGIMKLQNIFGLIPEISGKGPFASHVKDLLIRMRKESESDLPTNEPEIRQLILVDRHLDPLTPMPTQLTYEGLIDEIFGINNGYVHLQAKMIPPKEGQSAPPSTKTGTVPTPLNSNDILFGEVRDTNFSVLGPILNKHAKEVSEFHRKMADVKSGKYSIGEIRDYVKHFKNVISKVEVSLQLHLNIAEHIQAITQLDEFHKRLEAEQKMIMGNQSALDYIEDCVAQNHALLKILRLLVIHCHTLDGIKGKLYDPLIQDILQTYGYEYLPTIRNLERLGFLRKAESARTNFLKLRKSLNLIVDTDDKDPKDIAYVYSGFAPISVRLVELMTQPGWTRHEALTMLPGQGFNVTQSLPVGPGGIAPPPPQIEREREGGERGGGERGGKRSVVLVFFIGGVTFSEIAALRLLSQKRNIDFIIGTTKLINGDTYLRSILDSSLVEAKKMFCDQSAAALRGEEPLPN